jgi:hypothetical protein
MDVGVFTGALFGVCGAGAVPRGDAGAAANAPARAHPVHAAGHAGEALPRPVSPTGDLGYRGFRGAVQGYDTGSQYKRTLATRFK